MSWAIISIFGISAIENCVYEESWITYWVEMIYLLLRVFWSHLLLLDLLPSYLVLFVDLLVSKSCEQVSPGAK